MRFSVVADAAGGYIGPSARKERGPQDDKTLVGAGLPPRTGSVFPGGGLFFSQIHVRDVRGDYVGLGIG
jgi:hypothetical protein